LNTGAKAAEAIRSRRSSAAHKSDFETEFLDTASLMRPSQASRIMQDQDQDRVSTMDPEMKFSALLEASGMAGSGSTSATSSKRRPSASVPLFPSSPMAMPSSNMQAPSNHVQDGQDVVRMAAGSMPAFPPISGNTAAASRAQLGLGKMRAARDVRMSIRRKVGPALAVEEGALGFTQPPRGAWHSEEFDKWKRAENKKEIQIQKGQAADVARGMERRVNSSIADITDNQRRLEELARELEETQRAVLGRQARRAGLN